MVRQHRRERSAVREVAAEVERLALEQGFPLWAGAARMLAGWAAEGADDERPRTLQRAWDAIRATGARVASPWLLLLLAEEYRRQRQPKEAARLVGDAIAAARATGERFYEAELHRVSGEIWLEQAPPDEAQAAAGFQTALEQARAQQARSLELRAAISAASLLARQGRREAGHNLLSEVYGWFTEGFDTPDLSEARALLETLAR
jgi:adenylate cyclase